MQNMTKDEVLINPVESQEDFEERGPDYNTLTSTLFNSIAQLIGNASLAIRRGFEIEPNDPSSKTDE